MKKFLIATLVAATALSASALEVGVNAARSYSGTNSNGVGVSLGEQYGKVGVSVAVDRFAQTNDDQTILSLNGSYNVFSIGKTTIAATAGVAHLDNQSSADGYAVLVGAQVAVPVTTKVSFELGVSRLYGQERVNSSNGNTVTAGLKYSF